MYRAQIVALAILGMIYPGVVLAQPTQAQAATLGIRSFARRRQT